MASPVIENELYQKSSMRDTISKLANLFAESRDITDKMRTDLVIANLNAANIEKVHKKISQVFDNMEIATTNSFLRWTQVLTVLNKGPGIEVTFCFEGGNKKKYTSTVLNYCALKARELQLNPTTATEKKPYIVKADMQAICDQYETNCAIPYRTKLKADVQEGLNGYIRELLRHHQSHTELFPEQFILDFAADIFDKEQVYPGKINGNEFDINTCNDDGFSEPEGLYSDLDSDHTDCKNKRKTQTQSNIQPDKKKSKKNMANKDKMDMIEEGNEREIPIEIKKHKNDDDKEKKQEDAERVAKAARKEERRRRKQEEEKAAAKKDKKDRKENKAKKSDSSS